MLYTVPTGTTRRIVKSKTGFQKPHPFFFGTGRSLRLATAPIAGRSQRFATSQKFFVEFLLPLPCRCGLMRIRFFVRWVLKFVRGCVII